ncbi:hypothetical protein BT96DRAFT_1007242 [Gymnopus androsaceus JB14]|uniref:Uncharacterized protein n=1 Tax=Gymnopus androsaceus JB14 TaxID=1447944 RepID=A0A6A4GI65_9AGAR|nr:hypothetical protein BT96DRAFT_1007242 [Gymnopus androsaceus JB14]
MTDALSYNARPYVKTCPISPPRFRRLRATLHNLTPLGKLRRTPSMFTSSHNGVSTSTDQQAEPAEEYTEAKEPVRGGNTYLVNGPALSASLALGTRTSLLSSKILVSTTRNRLRLVSEVSTLKNPTTRNGQPT